MTFVRNENLFRRWNVIQHKFTQKKVGVHKINIFSKSTQSYNKNNIIRFIAYFYVFTINETYALWDIFLHTILKSYYFFKCIDQTVQKI